MPLGVRQKKQYGPRGLAEIRMYKDKVKVFIDDPDGGTDAYELSPDDLDDDVKSIKGVYVELTSDETQIRSIRPWKGSFPVKFIGFVKTREGVTSLKPKAARRPQPVDNPGWVIPAHTAFYAIAEIVSKDKHNGMQVIIPLVYLFERTIDGTMELVYEYKRHYDDLWELISLAGFDSDNDTLIAGEPVVVLDQLEDILLERNKKFVVKIEDGWLRELSEPVIGM